MMSLKTSTCDVKSCKWDSHRPQLFPFEDVVAICPMIIRGNIVHGSCIPIIYIHQWLKTIYFLLGNICVLFFQRQHSGFPGVATSKLGHISILKQEEGSVYLLLLSGGGKTSWHSPWSIYP